MRSSRIALGSGVVAVVAVLLFSSSLFVASGQTGKSTLSTKDVVMMRCNTTDEVFSATGYQGNSGTPSKRSNNCSENISQLMKEGFAIRDIGHYDMEKAGYVVITLVR